MDSKNIIASAISDYELAQAFSELVAERWDNWELTPFLPYLVDTVAATALPYLAEQFDIEGLQGFGLATTEEQRRDIIKKSIALHKFIGTPWAIREACRTIGFPVVILEEGATYIQNSGYNKAYSSAYSTSIETFCWACFRVLVEADMNRHITTEEARRIRVFVEYYKNERSRLIQIGFFQSLSDEMFRTSTEERDVLQLFTLSIKPNKATLDPSGNVKKVAVSASISWTISQNVFNWSDGTNDKFTISFTGSAGKSEIFITSDPNNNTDREVKVAITSLDGRSIGVMTVKQNVHWNAYSRAYNKAYNKYQKLRLNAYSPAYSPAYNNGRPGYINLSASSLSFIAIKQDEKQIEVQSNTKWIIS